MSGAAQRIFLCTQHEFVIVCDGDKGSASSRGTPKHRVSGCEECDKAVDDAFDFIDWPKPKPLLPEPSLFDEAQP